MPLKLTIRRESKELDSLIKTLNQDIYHSDKGDVGYGNDPEKLGLGEILSGTNIDRIAQAILDAGYIKKSEFKDIEKLEKDAINWFKMHIGNLSGCSILQRDNAYSLAIKALEERQAMKESRKSPTPRGLK